jgi:hypothetical protein
VIKKILFLDSSLIQRSCFCEMGRACGTYGKNRNAFRILVGRPEVNNSVVGLSFIWENNIKMGLRRIGRGSWTGFVRLMIHRISSCCEHHPDTLDPIK